LIYLDTSVVLPLLVIDSHSRTAEQRVAGADDLVVSHWTGAEVAAVLQCKGRERAINAALAAMALDAYRQLTQDIVRVVALDGNDGPETIEFVRRLELKLRAPDALHLAICRRVGAALLTFDDNQAAAAAVLGVALA